MNRGVYEAVFSGAGVLGFMLPVLHYSVLGKDYLPRGFREDCYRGESDYPFGNCGGFNR